MITDIGITAWGVYVPRYRLSRKTISNALDWLKPPTIPGEKAVAASDEDSLTMAVAAASECLKDVKADVDGLYFASTTSPYREGESASIIAAALDFSAHLRTADFANSLKAGTSAILSACDAVKAGSQQTVLVCAADCRLGKPGSSLEGLFGDGAASFLFGSENVVARFESSFSLSHNFPDYRRDSSDKFVRGVEDRFIREEGYSKFIPEAVAGVLQKAGMEIKDVTKVAYPSLNVKEHAAVGKKLGFQPSQVLSPMTNLIGETGCASPLMSLAAMLDEANPGDKILLVGYGDGSEALLFTVTDERKKVGPRRDFQYFTNSKRELSSYEKYLVFRNVLPIESPFDDDMAATQFPVMWRDRKTIFALYGSRCKRCGTPVYPAQDICVKPECGSIKEMEEYRFSDKKGKLFSFTAERVSFSVDPPLIFGFVDFEGGGRALLELTDCGPEGVTLGMDVELSFRKKYYDKWRGIHGYFWKASPSR